MDGTGKISSSALAAAHGGDSALFKVSSGPKHPLSVRIRALVCLWMARCSGGDCHPVLVLPSQEMDADADGTVSRLEWCRFALHLCVNRGSQHLVFFSWDSYSLCR